MVEQADAAAQSSRRKTLLWSAVALAAVIAAVIVYLVVTSGVGTPGGAPTGTPSSTTGSSPSASATPPSGEPSAPPAPDPSATSETMPELEPVTPDQPSDSGEGLVARIAAMKAVDGEAVQPGDIAGPSVQFRLELTNDTDADVDLGLIAVNAYIGEDRTPAVGLIKPGGSPFSGTLKPGDSAEGVYVYNIPEKQRDDVTLTIDYRAGQPAFVFRGPVG